MAFNLENVPSISPQVDTNLNDEPILDEAPLPIPVEATTPSVRQKDVELYNQWAADKSKANMGKLIGHLMPLVYTEVHRASGSLPTTALTAEAMVWAAKAVHSYDPSKGFALSTHVMNYLPKVRRMNYQYQNAVRLPENMQRQYAPYNKALTNLTEEFNREPTDEEMAKVLGWTKGYVAKYKGRLYADHIESASERPAIVTEYSDEHLLMQELRNRLTPEELIIWDAKINKMPAPDIAEKLGVNINRFNYLQKKLIKKISDLKMELNL